MKLTCSHVGTLGEIAPGLEVCESCMDSGGTWLHLRQCLTCGRTGCCDSSPNRHASTHARAAGHPVMQSLEPDEDWSWCFTDEVTLRRDPSGAWEQIDPFFDTGIWFAQRLAAESGAVEPADDATTPEGFPIGDWAATYRGQHRDGTLDPDHAQALEALPGWRW